MGHVYQQVKITALRTAKVRMFVDTGATFSIIPPDLAEAIGLGGLKKRYRVALATGYVVTMRAGTAFFKLLGRLAPATVLVGKVDEPILGVETLEALGLAVDPNSGKLRKTRAYAVRLGAIVRRQAPPAQPL